MICNPRSQLQRLQEGRVVEIEQTNLDAVVWNEWRLQFLEVIVAAWAHNAIAVGPLRSFDSTTAVCDAGCVASARRRPSDRHIR
jgi:hypothetical protein